MFEKYASYTVEDFVKDEHFINWAMHARPGEDAFWLAVIQDFPYQAEIISQAKHIVIQLKKAAPMDVDKKDVEDIWHGLENAIAFRERRVVYFTPFRMLAAACILFMIGLVWWKVPGKKEHVSKYAQLIQEAHVSLHEVVNGDATPMVVSLPDGSQVTLEPRSRLSYSKDLAQNETRDVFLSGGAFFSVTHNPGKPFMVYANEITTKVLGTSFSVKAFDTDKKVVVSVKTGKVSVFANKGNIRSTQTEGVTLIPNQQAIFSRAEEKLSRSLVEHPSPVIDKEELVQFSFSNAPVTAILEAVEKAYGVKIDFDREQLAHCRLTTSLNNETLFERLDIICEAIEATYKVEDGQVYISGQKCN
jgi:transmembrane sensor